MKRASARNVVHPGLQLPGSQCALYRTVSSLDMPANLLPLTKIERAIVTNERRLPCQAWNYHTGLHFIDCGSYMDMFMF